MRYLSNGRTFQTTIGVRKHGKHLVGLSQLLKYGRRLVGQASYGMESECALVR